MINSIVGYFPDGNSGKMPETDQVWLRRNLTPFLNGPQGLSPDSFVQTTEANAPGTRDGIISKQDMQLALDNLNKKPGFGTNETTIQADDPRLRDIEMKKLLTKLLTDGDMFNSIDKNKDGYINAKDILSFIA